MPYKKVIHGSVERWDAAGQYPLAYMEPHRNTTKIGMRKNDESGSSATSQASNGRFHAMTYVEVCWVNSSETMEGSARKERYYGTHSRQPLSVAPSFIKSPGTPEIAVKSIATSTRAEGSPITSENIVDLSETIK
jgi:hypothetical protein